MRKTLLTLSALCATLWAPLALHTPLAQTVPAAAAPATATPVTANARVIVKYRAGSTLGRMQALAASSPAAQRAGQAGTLSQRLGRTLRAGAGVAERSHVLFASGISSADLARQLAADPEIEYAVPDERRRAMLAPNDAYYAAIPGTLPAVGQWYLRAPAGAVVSSINVEPAWDITTGSSSVVVAVLDSGIRFDHPDLGANVLDGYDMISDDPTANDNTAGRDADASDPGDWITQAEANSGNYGPCGPQNSSWHGTEVAALVGALTNNGIGIASVGRNVRVLPVRVLGKCGGFDSDIIAAMRWSAGLATGDPSVPANPAANQAKVINLSLGGEGACSQAYRDAVNDINAAGSVVIASAGNSAGHAVATPANCPGVIAVSGLRHVGSKVGFADVGPEVTISAPGGNCINEFGDCLYPIVTATNRGTTTPAGSGYNPDTVGTSFSAPLVAGTVALMLSSDPSLKPLDVKLILQGTARPFPTSGATSLNGAPVLECSTPQYDRTGAAVDQEQCYCSSGTCGAGMLDAGAAVREASLGGIGNGVQARIDLDSRNAQAGRVLALSGANSIVQTGGSIASYLWTLIDSGGNVVTQFANGRTTAGGSSASVTPRAPGRFVLSLTVTDNAGFSSTARTTVAVSESQPQSNPPVLESDSGGGALGAGWLALLGVAVLALRMAARRA